MTPTATLASSNGAVCGLTDNDAPGSPLSAEESAAIRGQFPIFEQAADVAFLDNASTTQKPQAVIDSSAEFYSTSCANAGRASYRWATLAAKAIEESRNRIAGFIHAEPKDIAFTSGATESLNLIATGWGLENLKDGDQVLVCLEDHASAVMPWLNLKRLASRFGVNIEVVPFRAHDVGDYDLKDIRAKLTPRTRLIQMTHVHHLYGMDMEVADIREIVGPDVLISLDASQSIGHIEVEVDRLDVDFISFSGHKMFAANGVGCVWVNPRVQAELAPAKLGGKGAGRVEGESLAIADTTVAGLFEAGTQNIPAILSMQPALDFIEGVGLARIAAHLSHLTKYAYERLRRIPGIEFAPGPGRCGCPGGYGIISFRFEQVPTTDLGFMLDSESIFVRTGDHCMSRREDGDDFLRVSLHVYNTEHEIDRLIEVLETNLA